MAMGTTPTPHDAVFKKFLTRPETARDFLQIHLPAALLQHCNLQTLQLTSGSFIDKELRGLCSDVLYSLKTASGDGYIYCLIEHQSSPDKNMAFRLMRYAIAAMQRHLDQGHDKLPLVIPILFYHGLISPYRCPMNWLQAFGDPALASRLYSEDFPLVDITVIPDAEIRRHRGVALLEYLQKHIRLRDLMLMLEPLETLLQSDYITDEQRAAAMEYMLLVGETSDAELFIRTLAQRAVKYEDLLMTIAEMLEQKGRLAGRQEGRQEGWQQGRREEKRQIARIMLSEGLEPVAVMKITGLTEDELKKIRH
ncbi:Rpn family recombination-promoting nuclease/putative transposase [Pantoea sp. B65]|uniref:Rpn family recombination-promoting nuclease/putative transposase n=1 Tax=Pantoea sp. B65 TaxID=2813359 RepID=UPI0039B47053